MTVANLLTLLRIGLIPVLLIASLRGAFTIALVVFVGAALTDALDGYVARSFNQRSRLGAILDPAADKAMMIAGYVVFTIPAVAEVRLPLGLTVTVLLRDLLMVTAAYLMYTRIRIRKFPPTVAGKVSTILQAVALGVTMGANTPVRPFAQALLIPSHGAALLMTLYSGFDYVRRWSLHLERMDAEAQSMPRLPVG